jgi:transposase-like protein
MAGADRMTIQEVVKQVLLDEHADVIREAVEAVCAELMELEVSELVGAERGERRPVRSRRILAPSRRKRSVGMSEQYAPTREAARERIRKGDAQ